MPRPGFVPPCRPGLLGARPASARPAAGLGLLDLPAVRAGQPQPPVPPPEHNDHDRNSGLTEIYLRF
eukprot:COSAG01_NODE_4617_length_4876_cov_14.078082_1_plen_67_part_00